MSKITTLLLTAVLFLFSSFVAISATDKAVSNAKGKIADFVQVVELNADEEAQVYTALLAKEQNTLTAKVAYKGNKKGFKAATKPFNEKINRQIKEIIGKDRMKKMNKFYKAKRAASKK